MLIQEEEQNKLRKERNELQKQIDAIQNRIDKLEIEKYDADKYLNCYITTTYNNQYPNKLFNNTRYTSFS